MEAIILLFLIVLLILVIAGNGAQRTRLERLTVEMETVRDELQKLLRKENGRRRDEKPAEPLPAPTSKPKPEPVEWYPQPEVPAEPAMPIIPPPFAEVAPPVPGIAAAVAPAEPAIAAAPPPIPPPPRPSFFERNPDLEKFIGENLISKIGIAILVIGIGIFVKYAIDREWIGPAGRVGIGVLCGGILVGLAHKLQRNYKAFGAVLVGGGLAVLYFSIALAYKDYGLFPQPVAFGIMVVITVFAILLSLLYDRQEVAIIALAGGFAVPFLVSDGSGNYIALFTYLLLLNTGLLVIAYRKAWRLLNFIAFAATSLIFWAWTGTLPDTTHSTTFLGGLAFASAFYLLFLAINIANNIRERKKFIASDFGIILATNCLYFSAGLYLLFAAGAPEFKGLFSASLGVVNFGLAFILLRRRNIDATLLYLLIGVTLTFVSLTAPLQLDGHFITLFWAAESVVLLWLLQQSGIRLLQWGMLAVWICAFFSLLGDWTQVYGHGASLRVIANRGFMTTLFFAASNAALYRLMLRKTDVQLLPMFARISVSRFFGAVAFSFGYAAGAIELDHQFSHRFPGVALNTIYLLLYTAVFVLALRLLAGRAVIRLSWKTLLGLTSACLTFYLFAILPTHWFYSRLPVTPAYAPHAIAHWLAAGLIAFLFLQVLKTVRAREEFALYSTFIAWAGAAFAVIFISEEAFLLTKLIAQPTPQSVIAIEKGYTRIGLPIIWGLCSFAMMWLGMKHRYRPLRIASLTLFSITLLKLFLFDIRAISVAGKIAAFFSLGVLLLVVSFMYQRLKRIIVEDERREDVS